jgi:hypothetical protein
MIREGDHSMYDRRIPCTICIFVASLFAAIPAPSTAAMEPITFKQLVTKSETIVLAEVLRVEEAPRDFEFEPRDERMPPLKIATARVIETWKGQAEREIRFFASPLFQCDTSSAEKGQPMVLCLGNRTKSGIMRISHGGRGGMPIREVGNKAYATIDNFTVDLPEGTRTIPGPRPRFSFIRSIELSDVKELVRECSR